jgi:hypothetical protein
VEVKCPNCGEPIDLVGASDLKSDYGLSANSVQHARERGQFPEPYLSFNNRHIWLRADVQAYLEARSKAKLDRTVEELSQTFAKLSPAEKTEARKLLESIGVEDTQPARRRRKRA